MTSKTFKCVEHEEEVLEVYPFTGEEGGRKFSLLMPHVSSNAGIAFDSTTAPALALAILEAAGFKAEFHATGTFQDGDCWQLENVAQVIKDYLSIKDAEAAEAEAQAKLEAEALELYKTYWSGNVTGFSNEPNRDDWINVARRARELNKETP